MKFSYFGHKKKSLSLVTFSQMITATLSTVAPKLSTFLGKNILMRPYAKRAYTAEHLVPEKTLNLLTSMGIVHVNLFGQSDKVVIVSHGWADNSESFNFMIESLTNQGYCVAAVDHIGHGKSSGKTSHLLSFIETLEILLDHLNERRFQVDAIIGHSMGAVATLNLPTYLLENKKVILISSPIKFFELMFEKVERVGIAKKMLIQVLESISKQYGKTWRQLGLENHRDKLTLDLTFIHDKEDRYAPFSDLENFLKQEKTPLLATEGLGHRRILGDTSVIQNITQVLSS